MRKTISSTTIAGMLCLSLFQPVVALADGGSLKGLDRPTFGLGISGNLDFRNFRISGFSYTPIDGSNAHLSNEFDTLVSLVDGGVKVDMPLVTFGENVKYPGLIYNHSGTQLYQHIIYSYEGYEDSQRTIWPYVIGGVLIVGGVVALAVAASNSDDDSSSDGKSSGAGGTASSSSVTLTDQEFQKLAEQATPELKKQGVTDQEIQYVINQYNSLSDAEKQAYIDQYGSVAEEYMNQL